MSDRAGAERPVGVAELAIRAPGQRSSTAYPPPRSRPVATPSEIDQTDRSGDQHKRCEPGACDRYGRDREVTISAAVVAIGVAIGVAIAVAIAARRGESVTGDEHHRRGQR